MELKLNIPTELNEITLKQYKKFISIGENNQDPNFIQAKMIEIFCGVSHKFATLMKYSDVEEITGMINKLLIQQPKLVNTFKMDGIEYGFIPDLDDMTLGEYIDLDTYTGDNNNIEVAMNVLYRPIVTKLKNKYVIEKYNPDNRDKMLNMPMDAVVSSLFFFSEFRTGVVGNYPELFEQTTENQFGGVQNFARKYGWYQSLFALSGGDVIRIKNITELKFHECFLMLAFMKDKNELEQRELKKKFK